MNRNTFPYWFTIETLTAGKFIFKNFLKLISKGYKIQVCLAEIHSLNFSFYVKNYFRFEEDDELRKTTELNYILIPSNPRLEAPIEFKKQYQLDRDIQPGTVFGTVIAKTGAAVEYFTTSFKNEQHMNSMQWADIGRRTGQLRINQKPDGHLVNMEITVLSERFTKTITVGLLLVI